MKKIVVAAVAVFLGIVNGGAQERDSLVVVKTTSGKVTKTTTVAVRTGRDNAKMLEDGRVHLDFDIPFYKKLKKKPCEVEVGTFYVGSNFTNAARPYDFSPQNSMEFAFFMLDSNTKGRSTFSLGPGFAWRNFAITGDRLLYKADDGTIPFGSYPVGASPKVSKLRVFSISFPMLYTCNFGNGFGITLGPVVNLNANSSIVNKYRTNDEKQKDKYKNVHCNAVTVDAMAQLNLKYFSIYAKYSPMSLMDKKYWPEFQTWTIGISPF